MIAKKFEMQLMFTVEGLGIKDLLPPYLDRNLQDSDLITGVSFASAGSGLDNLTSKILVTRC